MTITEYLDASTPDRRPDVDWTTPPWSGARGALAWLGLAPPVEANAVAAPPLAAADAKASCDRMMLRLVDDAGALAWSSHALETAVEAVSSAVHGPAEPLVRSAWVFFEGRALDRTVYELCRALGGELRAQSRGHAAWDLRWMEAPATASPGVPALLDAGRQAGAVARRAGARDHEHPATPSIFVLARAGARSRASITLTAERRCPTMDDEVTTGVPGAPIPVIADGERWLALYAELRRLAHALMRRERADHTLQTTALVHEAWLRLGSARWDQRAHFMAAAARAMRCILTDHARGRGRAKRGGGQKPTEDVSAIADAYGELVDLLALDAALDRLAAVDEVAAQIVELRFFGGMTHDEVAALCGISRRTVDRTFRLARAYLYEAMATGPGGQSR